MAIKSVIKCKHALNWSYETKVRTISSIACEVSPFGLDYSDYPESFFNKIIEDQLLLFFSIKYHYSFSFLRRLLWNGVTICFAEIKLGLRLYDGSDVKL